MIIKDKPKSLVMVIFLLSAFIICAATIYSFPREKYIHAIVFKSKRPVNADAETPSEGKEGK